MTAASRSETRTRGHAISVPGTDAPTPIDTSSEGCGVHTGVNVTARLAALAQPGEILITADATSAAGVGDGLERRVLDLRGKQHQTEVVALQIGAVRSSL